MVLLVPVLLFTQQNKRREENIMDIESEVYYKDNNGDIIGANVLIYNEFCKYNETCNRGVI